MEYFLDILNKVLPFVAIISPLLFWYLFYRMKDAWKTDFKEMLKESTDKTEKHIKEYIDKKFLERENAELKDTLSRKQKYIDKLEHEAGDSA